MWERARQDGYTIATKDSDFSDMSVLRGFPPKVIWIRIGNCTTEQIEDLLRYNHDLLLPSRTIQWSGYYRCTEEFAVPIDATRFSFSFAIN